MSRVDEIRKRLEAATKGPWNSDRLHSGRIVVQDGNWVSIASVPDGKDARGIPNGMFIAAAPEDISYLLGRVEKLEELLDRLTQAATIATSVSDLGRYADSIATEARTLLADESKENAHGSK